MSFIFHTNTLKSPPHSQTNNLSLPWYAELFSIKGENTIPSNCLTCSSVFHYDPETDFCIYAQLQQNQDPYCVMSLQTLTSEQVILFNWLSKLILACASLRSKQQPTVILANNCLYQLFSIGGLQLIYSESVSYLFCRAQYCKFNNLFTRHDVGSPFLFLRNKSG